LEMEAGDSTSSDGPQQFPNCSSSATNVLDEQTCKCMVPGCASIRWTQETSAFTSFEIEVHGGIASVGEHELSARAGPRAFLRFDITRRNLPLSHFRGNIRNGIFRKADRVRRSNLRSGASCRASRQYRHPGHHNSFFHAFVPPDPSSRTSYTPVRDGRRSFSKASAPPAHFCFMRFDFLCSGDAARPPVRRPRQRGMKQVDCIEVARLQRALAGRLCGFGGKA